MFTYLFYFQESNFSKLDKADILEMTVKHIAAIQRNGILGMYVSYLANYS